MNHCELRCVYLAFGLTAFEAGAQAVPPGGNLFSLPAPTAATVWTLQGPAVLYNSASTSQLLTLPAGAPGLTLAGNGNTLTLNDGAGHFGYFSGATVAFNLSDITITGGTRSIAGSALTASALTLNTSGTVAFTNNNATGVAVGGAILSAGTTIITGNGLTLSGNQATTGGGLYSAQAATVAGGMTLTGNTARTNSGGAVYVVAGGFGVTGNLAASGNTAATSGGAITAAGGMTVNGGVAMDINRALSGFGGALNVTSGNTSLAASAGNVSLTNNSATAAGGAIYTTGAVTIGNAAGTVGASGNRAGFNSAGALVTSTSDGGAIYASGSAATTTLNGAVALSSNLATRSGGALWSGQAITVNGALAANGNSALNTHGGAIYATGPFTLNASSASTISGNAARVQGGAIWAANTVNLNALGGDIAFQGNRQGAAFDAAFQPAPGTGTPNAIYFATTGSTLNLNAAAGSQIRFFDPLAAVGTLNVVKTGDGDVVFRGDGGATNTFDTLIPLTTSVLGGTLTLADGVNYGVGTAGTLTVAAGSGTAGTLRGGDGASARALTINVASGGTVAVTGGAFTLGAGNINLQNGGRLAGNGTLATTVNPSLTGTVTADVQAGDVLTVSSLLTGSGGLAVQGDGTLALTAANTYTGGTAINGGTLRLGNGGTTGGISGNVANNGTLVFNRSGSAIFAGVISGGGAVNQLGPGSTVLTADSAYTGGTTIAAGALQLGNGGVAGSIAGDVLNNGALTFNRLGSFTFGGAISGVGAVSKLGPGIVVLTGASTYGGGTTIAGGNLQIGNGGATGSITGNVLNNGVLVFNRSGALALDGAITGSGPVSQIGSGTTTLSGAGSSAGAVNVQAGTLAFAQPGVFTAASHATQGGAATTLGAASRLNVTGTLTQAPGSVLEVAIGGALPPPAITAQAATVTGSTLNINGFAPTLPASATAIPGSRFTVLGTTGGITGDFAAVNLGGSTSAVDYLTLSSQKSADGREYAVGLGLTWLAGPALGNGEFTLADPADTFDMDVVLADQAAAATGWNGRDLTKNGAGTLILSAAHVYTGQTLVNGGVLRTGVGSAFAGSSEVTVGAGATLDLDGFPQLANALSGAGAVTLGAGTLTANNAAAGTTFAGVISGGGSLNKTGAGALTLTGANTYGGGTTIAAGTLQLGDGGTAGSVAGAVSIAGTLAFNRSDVWSFDGAISGGGAVAQIGPGTTVLTGDSSAFAGQTRIEAGALLVNGTLGGDAQVLAGGTLGGGGALTGAVAVDGRLSAGQSPGTLSVGSLVLNAGSTTLFEFGAPGVVGSAANDLVNVTADLALGGALDARVGAAGYYRLFNYGGALTGAFGSEAVTSTQAGFTPDRHAVQTGIASQVNLSVLGAGQSLQFWDGGDATGNGLVDGGAGTWSASGTNWTGQPGQAGINGPWAGSVGAFAGAAGGAVAVDGTQAFDTLQFSANGYALAGGSLALAAAGTLNIDTGVSATIGSAIVDGPANALTKVGGGTLVLSGANSYTGGTAIRDGVLAIAGDVNLGAASGGLSLDGGALRTSADLATARLTSLGAGGGAFETQTGTRFTHAGAISGAGALTKLGDGTLVLAGLNTYAGGTTISAGTLQLGAGGATGSILGAVENNGALEFNRTDTVVLDEPISGTGRVAQLGAGTTVLADDNHYSGGTAISAGTLQIGNGGAAGSITGNVLNEGALAFNRSDGMAFAGTISGSGAVSQTGSGVTTLSGAGSSAGAVEVRAGTLAYAQNGAFAAVSHGTRDGAVTAIGGASWLNVAGAFTQEPGSTLAVAVGASQPAVAAQTAAIGGSHLDITGFAAAAPSSASALTANPFTVIGTTGGISGEFATVDLGGAASEVDYLILAGGKSPDGLAYQVAFGLTWLAGPALGDGAFTLANPSDGFNVDVALPDQAASASGWNGRDLTKNGAGTLILSASNRYTGQTLVNGGTLQAGIANAFADSAAVVVNSGATLALNGFSQRANQLSGAGTISLGAATLTANNPAGGTTYAGVISGPGALNKTGAGTLTLTAANTYSGGTTVALGTLQIGDGGASGSIVGPVLNNGTLAINRSDSVAFDGAIAGNGAIRQIGGGVTRLTGDNRAFAGTTTVAAGTLAVDGPLGGALDVLAAGRLQGGGAIGSATISGTVAPGSSIGTLNVAGNLRFDPGSIYEVEVDAAGRGDRIAATGVATINGGTVRVLAGAGDYAPATTYTILAADGGRSGTFADVSSNLAFLSPALGYDPNHVYLTLTRNTTSFAGVGLTRNQIAAGGGIESLGPRNPLFDAVLDLSAVQSRAAFDRLSGEIHASAAGALMEDSHFVRDAAASRLRSAFGAVAAPPMPVVAYAGGGQAMAAPTADRFVAWGHAFGGWGDIDSDGNAASLDSSTSGFLLGADVPAFDNWRLGVLAGYSRTRFDVDDRASSGNSDNYHLGLYGGAQWGALGLRSGVAYTWHNLSTSRSAAFPGFGDSLRSKYDAGTTQVFGELGYRLDTPHAALEPFAGLAYARVRTDGFTEQGGAAALNARVQTMETTFSTVGLRASTRFMLGKVDTTARGTLGWKHAFGDVAPTSTQAFAGGSAFVVGGVPIARDSAVIETGLDFEFSPRAKLGVSYQGQIASSARQHAVMVNLAVRF
ncbi:autotransporter domain-containing protein [Achromobacter sp. NPDC058515]|uniref:autotransporter domain-containing protein n=1 Tax=Achromobacter sp. NPDC058515 TaxID=3346533 RepID=UPI0036463975